MKRECSPRSFRRRDLLKVVGGACSSLALAGCADDGDNDPNPGLPTIDSVCDGNRTDSSELPFETEGRYGGWGGHSYHGTEPGLTQRPVVFVHGNGRDACDFDEQVASFIERGYRGDALWSITFERETSTHAEMAEQIDSFVGNVREETRAERVDLVGHSLGVTGIRHWLDEIDRYDWAHSVVGLAGANHGTWTCGPGCSAGPGTTRVCGFVSHACADTPGEALYELNEPNETPGSVAYYTIRGTEDDFFRTRPRSSELDGAQNVALEGADHDDIRTSETTKDLLFEWLSE